MPVLLFARGALEVLRDLLPRKMDRGHHHVRGALAAQLDYPFAEVRLADAEPRLFEMGVEADLLRRHGFGFDDVFHAAFGGDARNRLARFPRVRRPMHGDAAFFGLALEFQIQLFEIGRGRVLGFGDSGHEPGAVDFPERRVAAGTVLHRELVERAAEKRVVER